MKIEIGDVVHVMFTSGPDGVVVRTSGAKALVDWGDKRRQEWTDKLTAPAVRCRACGGIGVMEATHKVQCVNLNCKDAKELHQISCTECDGTGRMAPMRKADQ